MYEGEIQRQIFPGVAVVAGYYRRQYYRTRWTDNLSTTHADYALLQIADPRGNGQTIPVYNLAPAKVGAVRNRDAQSANTTIYNGFDVSMNARLSGGAQFLAGISSGVTNNRTCQVDDPNGLLFCDENEFDVPYQTQLKLSGSHPLPWGVSAGAVFQSVPGNARQITYLVTRAVLPQLSVSSVTIPLSEPGSLYLDRLNQLDLSFSKAIRYRRARIAPQIGIFNVTNAATVISQINAYGVAVDRVQEILDGRIVRFGVQVDF